MMRYELIDGSGYLVAEVKFNSRIVDDLVAVYLQDMCECVGAIGYNPVKEPLTRRERHELLKATEEEEA